MFDQIFKIEISANAVAWYGAIVATIVAVVAVLGYLKDRAKIKVKISNGLLGYGDRLGDNVQIFIEAINVGRRPVTLKGAGFSLKNKENIVILRPEPINFPYELQEGKSVQIWTDRDGLLRDAAKENTRITHAWYRDATGKIYKTKFPFSQKK